MTTNKERIENLEASVGGLQHNLDVMEKGVTDKLHHLEEIIGKLSDLIVSRNNSSSGSGPKPNFTTPPPDGGRTPKNNSRPWFSSKLAKLEFPKFSGDNPTEWFNRVQQFFKYQGTEEVQKVALASFHLEGEANQWWQWIQRSYRDDNQAITWQIFHDELWARFGPTDCEDFDEALSKITQTGTLRDYQKEFEKLGNRVQGWTQKALVGTFMGGLKPEVAEGIRMFKPQSLKDAISLARMYDDQLNRHRSASQSISNLPTEFSHLATKTTTPTIKKLTWEEMQKWRT